MSKTISLPSALVLEGKKVFAFMVYTQYHIYILLVWALNEELLSARVQHSWRSICPANVRTDFCPQNPQKASKQAGSGGVCHPSTSEGEAGRSWALAGIPASFS